MDGDPMLPREIRVPAGAPVKREKTPEVRPRTSTGWTLLHQSSLGSEGSESLLTLPSAGAHPVPPGLRRGMCLTETALLSR